jgi:hypothetical protein
MLRGFGKVAHSCLCLLEAYLLHLRQTERKTGVILYEVYETYILFVCLLEILYFQN